MEAIFPLEISVGEARLPAFTVTILAYLALGTVAFVLARRRMEEKEAPAEPDAQEVRAEEPVDPGGPGTVDETGETPAGGEEPVGEKTLGEPPGEAGEGESVVGGQ
jgi:hypothetical protein